jgi:CRP-like cAMP-binding protein
MEAIAIRKSEALLFALVQAGEERLRKHAREVPLSIGDDWLESDTPRYVHFLRSGAVSRVICLNSGQCASVRLSAPGELLEMHSVAKVKAYADRFVVILPGRVLRVPLSLVQEVFTEDARFRSELISQVCLHSAEAARTSVCNVFHQIEARLARYLTTLVDYWTGPLPITQETLAEELGVQRTSINLVAGELRKRGILSLRRGSIEVTDRGYLARLACECHKPFQHVAEDETQDSSARNGQLIHLPYSLDRAV